MDTGLVFEKTGKGREEIESRRYHLDSRHRLALILVDGRSNVRALHAKAEGMSDLEPLLEDLAVQGFIAADDPTWLPPSNGGDQVTGPALIQRELVDLTILSLGRNADKAVKILRESATTHAALTEAAERCVKLVRLTIDESKSGELRAKFHALLGLRG